MSSVPLHAECARLQVALDLLDGRESEATRLRFVRTRPLPFLPEPLRSAVIQLTPQSPGGGRPATRCDAARTGDVTAGGENRN